jgi:hypothetical protein
MTTIPRRPGGYLTDEEEQALRDPANWDWSRAEVYEGSPDARVIVDIELDGPMMTALDTILGDDPTDFGEVIQRWVEERIAAEVAALDVDEPDRATRTA